MRRAAAATLVATMAMVLTGCPVPPPGYYPPAIDSVVVSPDPVQPGETVRFEVEARDDQTISSAVARRLLTPSGIWLRVNPQCTVEVTPHEDPKRALLTFECVVPTYASNGTWGLEVQINDGPPLANYPGLRTRLSFEVTGGSEDRSAPHLVQYSTDPAVIDQETSFTLTMRLSDETHPITVSNNPTSLFWFVKLGAPNSTLGCGYASQEVVSATEVDVTLTCHPENYWQVGRSEPGLHRSGVTVSDALGHERSTEMYIDVQPS